MGLISAGIETFLKDQPGSIFVRPGDQISSEDRILFQSVARAILIGQPRDLWWTRSAVAGRAEEVTVPQLTRDPSPAARGRCSCRFASLAI